jgi:hypothetical protein
VTEVAHEHAVSAGKVHHLSVSQLQAFDRCNRLWYFDKILHLPGKEFKGQTIGKEGHARLEAFYRSGGATNVLSPLELLGLDRGCVPHPTALHIPEHRLGTPVLSYLGRVGVSLDARGVPVEGYIDLLDLNGLLTDHVVRITDWKFKKSIDKYGIRESEIFDPNTEAGTQLIGYAEWARRQFPTARFIEVGHVTFQTQGARDVVPVYSKISVDLLPKLWDTVCRNVDGLRALAARQGTSEEADFSTVAPTFSACSKYGGCAYIPKCHDPLSRLTAAITASSRASYTPLKTEGKELTMGLLTPQPAAHANPISAQDVAVLGSNIMFAAITPPDEPAPTIVSTPGSKVIVEDHTADPAPEVIAPGVSGVVPVTPRKRGRPPKVKAAELTPPAPAVTPAPAAVPSDTTGGGQSQQAEAVTSIAPQSPGVGPAATGVAPAGVLPTSDRLTLYFNCTPVNTPTASLADFTKKVEAAFMEKAQVSFIDLRAATGNELGYNKWESYLAAAAAGRIAELPPGDYVVVETDRRIQVVAEALAALPGVKSVRPFGGR